MPLNLDTVNTQLRRASPEHILRWALGLGQRTIATTSFGRNAAVMLHLVSEIDKSVPTVWVDTGYNLRDTYLVAEKLIKQLDLNMHIYSPEMTSERRNALLGGVPTVEDEGLHSEFTRQVKLDPFERALQDLQPEIWLTGLRREETEHRQTLDIVSRDARGIIKVAPLFYWSEQQIEAYMASHQLRPPRCARSCCRRPCG